MARWEDDDDDGAEARSGERRRWSSKEIRE